MLTPEQVSALAPDPASAKSGRDLATKRKWLSTSRSGDIAIWGECQGSGSSPYQASVDLAEPAFKCSCPSRKFPCKHGLGLLMLFAVDPPAFSEAAPPDWVSSWLESRAERAAKQAAKKTEETEKPVDAVAQAKRIAQREDRITAGLDDLDQWLRDLVRRGIANVDLGYKFWDTAAARLVDSQAPGLARMVREMSGIPSSGPGWQDRLVERIGLMYLAVQGYRRAVSAETSIPQDAAADLRTIIGWTQSQEDVLARSGVRDRWNVMAQNVEEDDRLQVQRTWLLGERTRSDALILQFAHGSQGFETALAPGTAFDGELAFFPSAYPLRALVKSRESEPAAASIAGYRSIQDAVDAHGRALAKFPWLDRFPMALGSVVPVRGDREWRIIDSDGTLLPITARFVHGWRLLALSGGRAVTVCGEWNGVNLLPLGVYSESGYTRLA